MQLEVDQHQLLKYIKVFLPIYWVPRLGRWWYQTYMQRLEFRLDDDCAISEKGVFFYTKKRVPYAAVREASVYRGPILQLLGVSLVIVQTSGQNQGYPEITYPCLQDPEAIAREITDRAIASRKKEG